MASAGLADLDALVNLLSARGLVTLELVHTRDVRLTPTDALLQRYGRKKSEDDVAQVIRTMNGFIISQDFLFPQISSASRIRPPLLRSLPPGIVGPDDAFIGDDEAVGSVFEAGRPDGQELAFG